MQDAHYFRTQAEFCLKLATQVSDARAVENLRATAANHFSKAVELEAEADAKAGGSGVRPPNNVKPLR